MILNIGPKDNQQTTEISDTTKKWGKKKVETRKVLCYYFSPTFKNKVLGEIQKYVLSFPLSDRADNLFVGFWHRIQELLICS